MNKVILMGRLTADPELRQTPNGIASCRFTVAVNRSFVDKNTGERQADFISCTAWRQTAEFVTRYFNKGSMIMVEGSIRTGSYQDKKYPDITHYTTEVYVDNVEFTGSKKEGGNNNFQPNGNNFNGGYNNGYNNNGGYNNGSNGSYNNGGYGNGGYNNGYNGGFNQPQQPMAPQPQNNDSMSYGNSNDFEEIISDGDVPF